MVDITFQYPPELMNLLIETIPVLNRSKDDVLLFFRGAGVPSSFYNDIEQIIKKDRDRIRKHSMTRTILTRLNEKGEAALGLRREVLKRVAEFESFAVCWPKDQYKAMGLVSEIRKVVNIKDTFTKINLEREKERKKHQANYQKQISEQNKKREALQNIHKGLVSLFREQNHWKRGKVLEGILNKLFSINDILIKEAFTLKGNEGEGIVEQIDGVVEIDNHTYLVEMKWLEKNIGPGEISPHLVRVYSRAEIRGVFISASEYTAAAIKTCTEALQQKVFILCSLSEIIFLLEREIDLTEYFRDRIRSALIEKNPIAKSNLL